MVDFISSNISIASAGTSTGGSDAATFSQLEKCKRQLGDWKACPSGKTPEGQRIIDNLRAQISRLESRTQQSTSKVETIKPADIAAVSVGSNTTLSGLGRGLDTWA